MRPAHGIGELGGTPLGRHPSSGLREEVGPGLGGVCGAPLPRRRGRVKAGRQRAEEENHCISPPQPLLCFVLHLRQEGMLWGLGSQGVGQGFSAAASQGQGTWVCHAQWHWGVSAGAGWVMRGPMRGCQAHVPGFQRRFIPAPRVLSRWTSFFRFNVFKPVR